MIELTSEQWQIIRSSPLPLRFIDPTTLKVYVLIDEVTYGMMHSGHDEIDPSFYDVVDLPTLKNPAS